MKRSNKKVLAVTLVLSFLLTACGGGASEPATSVSSPSETSGAQSVAAETESSKGPSEAVAEATIYMFGKENQYDAWLAMKQAGEVACKELGVGKFIYEAAAGGESDVQGQIALVENAISANASAILLAANDSDALASVCDRVKEAGIPLILFDSGIASDSYDLFIALDNYQCGVNVANSLADYLGGKGQVGIISAVSGPQTIALRENGFIDTIKEKYPDIEIVGEILYSNNDTARAMNQTHDLLNSNPDLDAIFTTNTPTAEGICAALLEANSDVKVASFDSSETAEAYLQDGIIVSDSLSSAVNMGYLSVLAAVKLIDGETIDKLEWNGQTFTVDDRYIDSGATVGTPENVGDPEIQSLLHPLSFFDSYQGADWYN